LGGRLDLFRTRRGSRNRDLARLELLGDVPLQVNEKQTVLQGRTLDLNVIGKLEAALKGPGGDTAIKQLSAFLSVLFLALTLDGQHVAVGFNRKLVFREAGHRHGDAIRILTGLFDVVGRIGLRAVGLAKGIQHCEQAIKADGRAIKGGKVQLTHSLFSFEQQVAFWCLQDRKSTRLNSSHVKISYAVFCLKKKKH